MTRSILAPVLVAGALLSLTGCLGPAAEPTPTDPPRPPSMAGEWVIDRAIVASTDDRYPIDTQDALYILFTEEGCTETECAGTIVSGTSPDERETNFSEGTYVNTAGELRYEFPEALSDCIADAGGTVIATGAYGNTVSYTATVTATDEERILGFEGSGQRILRITQVGIDTGTCRPLDTVVDYEVTAARG